MALFLNGKEMSPCICAKAKVALDIPNRYSGNITRCSKKRWDMLVDYFGKLYNKSPREIAAAKANYLLGQ